MQVGRKIGPKALNGWETRGNTFGLMSPSCGLAAESTISETRCFAVASRRCMNFGHARARVVAVTAYLFEGAAVRQSQKLRSAALRLHLPSGPEAFWVLLALSDETRYAVCGTSIPVIQSTGSKPALGEEYP